MTMSAKPLLSVIIPTYNYAGVLPRAVESVLSQATPEVELWVVDDGSTDDTPAVFTALRQRHGAAFQGVRQANAGVSQAEVAAALGMDRETMMAVIDRLEDRGFVIRKRSTSDRRRQDLYLTPAGQNTLRKCKTKIAEHEEKFRELFSAAELTSLLDALKRFQSLG